MGRQGIGHLLILAGGGTGDELGEFGVGRVLQDEGRVRGRGSEDRYLAGFGLEPRVVQGACGAAARLGVDRPGQDVADLGAGPAPDGGLEPLRGGGELEDPAGRARSLELLGDEWNLLSGGAQRHNLRVIAAVSLMGPDSADHHRGEQEKAGGNREGRLEPARTT